MLQPGAELQAGRSGSGPWRVMRRKLKPQPAFVLGCMQAEVTVRLKPAPSTGWSVSSLCFAVKIIDLEGLTMRDVGSTAFKW